MWHRYILYCNMISSQQKHCPFVHIHPTDEAFASHLSIPGPFVRDNLKWGYKMRQRPNVQSHMTNRTLIAALHVRRIQHPSFKTGHVSADSNTKLFQMRILVKICLSHLQTVIKQCVQSVQHVFTPSAQCPSVFDKLVLSLLWSSQQSACQTTSLHTADLPWALDTPWVHTHF